MVTLRFCFALRRLVGRRRWLLCAVALLAQAACYRPGGFADRSKPAPRDAVVLALEAVTRSGKGLPGSSPGAEELAQIQRLYAGSGHAPLWFTASGDLTRIGKDAMQRLVNAESEGLRPSDYAAPVLDSLARRVSAEKDPAPESVARLDAGLSLAVLQYLRHIHVGRVNPRSIGLAMDPPQAHRDYAMLLETAQREGALEEIVAELVPPLAQYRLARSALAEYRSRQSDSVEEEPLLLPVPLKPGEAAPGLAALARRLMLTGDLPRQTPAESIARYEGDLIDAVQRFQARHGLTADSVLGKATLAELNVPFAWRIHQLELTLERLRWLRDLGNEPFLLVNIPMFELTGWDSPLASGPPAFRAGVIVGKALDTETPVFVEAMRYVIFQPYWNIPPSIARDETIPAIERDSDYVRKNNLEIVEGQGDDAELVEPSGSALDRVERGQLRIRQRPGRSNSLGPIKFVFPNHQNIYVHGTSAEELFDRTRRDFSHGCVRVEDPTGLAEWVLRDQPEWTRDRIVEAMNEPGKLSRQVSLSRPLAVVLFYATASVEADGTVRFARDIYQHDQRLAQALRSAAP